MMMTEVAGMGTETSPAAGTAKGKAFNLMRQRSSSVEEAAMATFMNNNNNNNNLEVVMDNQSGSPLPPNNNRSHHQEHHPLATAATAEKGGGEEHPAVAALQTDNDDEDMDMKKSPTMREEGETRQLHQQDYTSSRENSPSGRTTKSSNDEDKHLGQQNSRREEDEEQDGGMMMVLDEEDEDDGGFSDDEGEMPGPRDADDDSDRDEHRIKLNDGITVREALMSRAYQAAAAKYGHGGSKYSAQRPSSGGGQSSPSSSSPSMPAGMNGHSRSHGGGGHHHHHRDHHHRDHTHLHQQSSRHGYTSHHQPQRHPPYLSAEAAENFIKAERRSHPSSPLDNCDLKPESLAGGGGDAGGVNGLGNALLMSLGGLAALQQSIPNFMATMGHHNSAPLNLTHSNARDLLLPPPPHMASSQPQSRSSPHSNGSNNPATMSPNSLIASAIANITGGSGPQHLHHQQQGSIPQLILASGQISQGIQGAQLLIPTSQGIMSQTVLTIPISQPGSPPTSLSPSIPSQLHHHATTSVHLPQNHAGSKRHNHHNHHQQHQLSGLPVLGPHHHRSLNHPQSPPIASAPTAAQQQRSRESASPDFPHDRTRNLMGLGSHVVGQTLGGHMPTIPEKGTLDHHGGVLNGIRNMHGKRERVDGGSSGGLNLGGNCGSGSLCPPKSSPCSIGDSIHDHDSDKFSDTEDDQMVDGINLDEIKEFAKAFKLRRLSLGLTQTQVGQALSITEGPAYSQSAICRFEKLDITPKSAQKIKPVLERWMKEAEERYKNGHQNLNEFVGMEPSKKRKRRTSFTPQALEILNNHFERNTHPSGAEITTLAHQLGYEREVIRIWFCNKRQALKNTVRMMSKSSSPM
ncbi:POU domain, class 6, transcription factor 2 isoform X2 [Folsomia candida]|uniref:POU domain, class 6, transcription factor 2 isoform X2 n=1 Tax=Folsomia candida TaxID=158441 RepID=UPI000B9075EA|nr:POU domain, class 6, transcription factor 2 isoform X2 [Folsomia candida]